MKEKFALFDADNSGGLDMDEFTNMMSMCRSLALLDSMPGEIYCGGKLMNPSQNVHLLYRGPYEPKTVLAKAVAKPSVPAPKPIVPAAVNTSEDSRDEGPSGKDAFVSATVPAAQAETSSKAVGGAGGGKKKKKKGKK